MTYKVGPKGQVVLPKAVRERLGIHPGDEVFVEELDGEIRIRRADPVNVELRGLLRDERDPIPLTRAVEAEHRWELARDALREAEWEVRDAARNAR